MSLLDSQELAQEDGEEDTVGQDWTGGSSLESQQDMFQQSQEENARPKNPLLVAKARREELVSRPAFTSQRQECRNPFLRKAAGGQGSPATSNSGLAFDSAVPVKPSPIPSKSSLPASLNRAKVCVFCIKVGS